MKKRVDLHIHTNQSDGVHSPLEVLEFVRHSNLSAFAVTDHDTLEGYLQIRKLLTDGDPELIEGLELSCTWHGSEMHILAYLFDPNNKPLLDALRRFQEKRNHRGRMIVQKLNELGVDISFDDVRKCAGQAPVGRPHVAEAMCRMKAITTHQAAFQKFIGDRGPAYVPKENFTPAEAIDLIHQAGGVAALAHPVVNDAVAQVETLVELGLDAIEAYHPDHRQSDVDRLKHLAERYHLMCTGGSDFHGREGRYGKVGSEPVPEEYLDRLKQAAKHKRGSS